MIILRNPDGIDLQPQAQLAEATEHSGQPGGSLVRNQFPSAYDLEVS